MLTSPSSHCLPRFSDHHVAGHSFRVAHWRSERGGSALPLLFFTGLGANIELLAPFLERLGGRDVITFDMPGVGGTPDYARPYRLSAMADAAAKILSELECRRVDVMGVSWGGMLAQEFAYRHGDMVKRLVLAATTAGLPMLPGSPATLVKMLSSHRYSEPAAIRPYLQALYGGSGDGLDGYASRMRTPTATGYRHQLLAICGWTSARKLTRVTAQTLVLMGEDDKLVPPVNGHILKFFLKDATLKVLQDAGHLFVLTHVETVTGLIEDFLDSPSRPLSVPPYSRKLCPLPV